jgi:hypothetical protein
MVVRKRRTTNFILSTYTRYAVSRALLCLVYVVGIALKYLARQIKMPARIAGHGRLLGKYSYMPAGRITLALNGFT